MKKQDAVYALLPGLDAVAIFLSYTLAFFIRRRTDLIPFIQTPESLPPYPVAARVFVVFAVTLVLVHAINGLYRFGSARVSVRLPRLLWSTTAWWFGVVGYYGIIAHELFFSRLVLIYGAAIGAVLLLLNRLLVHALKRLLQRRGRASERLLLIGENSLASRIIESLQPGSVELVGVLTNHRDPVWEAAHPQVRFLGGNDELPSHVSDVDEVLVCAQGLRRSELEEMLELCHRHYCRFRFVPDLFEIHTTNIVAEEVGGLPVLELKPTRLDGWGRILKRSFDVLSSLILLLLLSPVLAVVGLLVRLSSPGPAVVGLTRVRLNETFRMYKFRSMIDNAHALKKQLLQQNERQGGPLFKMKNDPRITPLGRFLRKSRLDELPQLWNVLRGDMSLVGPRAHEPEEVSQYERYQQKLLAILPGMTGMAQVHGASDLTFDEEVRLDTYYIEHWSLLLDLEILFRTVMVVLTGRGAA